MSRVFSPFAAEKMIDLVINGGALQDSTASVAVNNQPGENSPGPVTPTAVRKAAPSSARCLSLPTSAGFPDTMLDAGVTGGGGWADPCCMARKDKVKGRRQA